MTTISDERLAEVGTTLNFFASVIKSGETWTATCQRELDNAHAALSALRAQGGVRVKPLEWSSAGPTTQAAETILGWYHIDRRWNMETPPVWYWNRSGGWLSACETEDEAKAAAQADYERRIVSALEASPVEAGAAAARERITEVGPVATLIDNLSDEELAADHSDENPNVGLVEASPAPVSEEMVLMPRALDGVALHSLANYLGYTPEETDELYSEIVSRAALAAKGGQ